MRSESEGWTGLDGEGEAQGGLRMMPLEAGERPSPGNLAETSCTGKAPALYPACPLPHTPRPPVSPASLLGLPLLSAAALSSGYKSHEKPIIKFYGK